MNKRQALTRIAAALALAPAAAPAQDASQPITIVVPYAAGGSADLIPRLLAQRLQASLGVPILVVNKPGAAGNLGAEFVANAPPDGRTLLVVAPHFFFADLLYKIRFAPRDFVPISNIASYPSVLLVGPKRSTLDLKGLVAAATASAAPMSVGSPGVGTSQHLSIELLRMLADIRYTHVPYKGSSAVLTDLASGHLDFAFDNLLASQALIQAGRLKVIGVGSATRNKNHPTVPAINEVVPGFESVSTLGIVAPPGTPRAVADRLGAAFAQAARAPEVMRQLEEAQAEVVGSSAAEMAASVRVSVERWSKVIRAAKVTPE
jgi:tripartite-type tricarboxylate transporter receptor subunit TctC